MPLLGMEAEIGFRFLLDAPPRNGSVLVRRSRRARGRVSGDRDRRHPLSRLQGDAADRAPADCMSNGAYVVGGDRPDWRAFDLSNIPVTLAFGDQVIVQRSGGHTAGDPLKPAVELVNALRASTGVRAGQMMTTGTYTGLNFATPGRRIRAAFEGFGAAEDRHRLGARRGPGGFAVLATVDEIRHAGRRRAEFRGTRERVAAQRSGEAVGERYAAGGMEALEPDAVALDRAADRIGEAGRAVECPTPPPPPEAARRRGRRRRPRPRARPATSRGHRRSAPRANAPRLARRRKRRAPRRCAGRRSRPRLAAG